MQFFALETNTDKIRKRYVDKGDELILSTRFHPLKLWLAVAWQMVIGTLIVAAAVAAYEYTAITLEWTVLVAAVLFVPLVFLPMLKRYIEWRYDFIDIFADKVVIVDQGSIFKQSIKQINMENFASVESETQYLNLFPFGKILFNLKEGEGEAIMLGFIPNAAEVADDIADAVSSFQRRREFHEAPPPAPAAPPAATPMP